MYQILRRMLFTLSPETAHYLSMNCLQWLCSFSLTRSWIRKSFSYYYGRQVSFAGLRFKNPVGLGAGFDKNARYLRELEALGFGFVEIGTVTPRPQAGNEKPRLFRLPKDKALVNRMGFNNDGVEVIAARLRAWRKTHPLLLVGGNIGKNKATPNEEAWKDYEACFLALHPYVDFFVVNVSSPNTPGLRALQEKEALAQILTHLQNLNAKQEVQRPILLKIAPDLNEEQILDVISLARAIRLDGLVASNTTISREGLQTGKETIEAIGAGGLSGLPLRRRATEVARFLQQHNSVPFIASGGIFGPADAKEKLAAGATMVEVWTGFIYEGPGIVKRILKGMG